jgi:hypothetical protein
MLWGALRADIAAYLGKGVAKRLLPYLQARLTQEGGVIFLDGLDEVPEAHARRATLLKAVGRWTEALPDSTRFLVTARPYAYADPRWHLDRFPTVLALAPFNEGQVNRFVERWYQAVRPAMGLAWSEETARDKAQKLSAALRERDYLADLASRPLLLTLMATLHSSWGQLPDDRADLYEETVKLLLARWQRARQVTGADGQPVIEPGISQVLGAGDERIRHALELLAYTVHQRQGQQAGRGDMPANIGEGDVLVAFKPLLGSVELDSLLGYLRDRAGLLIGRREGVYAFPHRSIQEYLAACHLSNQPGFLRALRDLAWEDAAWWREVCLLGMGRAKRGGLDNAVAHINRWVEENPEDVEGKEDRHWRLAALAGQALCELGLVSESADAASYAPTVKRVRRWLLCCVEEGHLPARERAAAGDVLGQLGDPRFDAKADYLPCRYRGEAEPCHGFVRIAAGPFVMGEPPGGRGSGERRVRQPGPGDDPLRLLDGALPGDRGAVRRLYGHRGVRRCSLVDSSGVAVA